jgi:hypothetical protein
MRIVRLTCLFAMLLALAGCASSSRTVLPNQPASGSVTPSGGFSSAGSGSPASSPSRQPVPAPSDSDGLQVSGPVAVSLLSRSGPLDPAGPYLGMDIAQLLDGYQSALGRQPTCLPAGCWSDARVPSGSVLLAVRPESVACYQLTHITTAQSAGAIRIDLQLNYVCRTGAGTAARMAGWLFALPANARPANGGLEVTVRVSPRPGMPYTMLGGAATMP